MAIASSTTTPHRRVDHLLEKINDSVAAWQCGDERSREEIVSACFKMIEELEHPSETIVRMTWQQPSQLAALQTAVDLDLCRHINAGTTAKSTSQLAEKVNTDPALMARILRVLSSIGVIHETESDHFTSTPMSVALESPDFMSTVNLETSFAIPANLKTPAYLRDNNYRNPTDIFNTPMQFCHGGKGELNVFQLLQKQDYAKDFGAMMKVWTKDLKHWSDDQAGFYPFQDRLVSGAKKENDDVFMVDVGGGQGNDLLKLLKLHPQETLPGRLVLQDLPTVIDTIPAGSLPDTIQTIGYDFFTPQPIKGARTYFLHNVIHDHSDARAKLILQNLRAAMEPGYSKLLIWDFALQDKDIPPFIAAMDWEMMTYVAGRERTERDWRALIEDSEVDMKVVGVWHYSQFDQSVIEVEVA